MTILTPTPHNLALAAAALARGEVVAMPTETVYGLAGDATSSQAVGRIYALKGRPLHNPLIVHVASIREAMKWAAWTEAAQKVAEAFWPGPLTIVLPVTSSHLAPQVTAGLSTVALRVPASPVTLDLLRLCPFPLAAPSANPSGKISPTSALDVARGFGATAPVILDGGESPVGLESTIVDLSGPDPLLLRPGFITPEALGEVLGVPVRFHQGDAILAPGMMTAHYAPDVPVRLEAPAAEEDEVFITFGSGPFSGGCAQISLSARGDLFEAAQHLYAALHEANRLCAVGEGKAIAIAPLPAQGIGMAIRDRLTRAAAAQGRAEGR